jgi:hypothetical protein
LRETCRSRQIALIGLPRTKNARRIRAIVSTPFIPRPPAPKPEQVAREHHADGGQNCTPIPRLRGVKIACRSTSDITLNPRTEFYSHRVELEALVMRSPDGSGEGTLDALLENVANALAVDPSLGGLSDNLRLGPPEIGAVAIAAAVSILTARLTLTVEYLASDPLAA